MPEMPEHFQRRGPNERSAAKSPVAGEPGGAATSPGSSAACKPLEPDDVRPFLLGRTISALYVHTDDVGAIDWIAFDFEDGTQAEINSYGMHGMEAGLDVEPGTRIRDIYKVVAT